MPQIAVTAQSMGSYCKKTGINFGGILMRLSSKTLKYTNSQGEYIVLILPAVILFLIFCYIPMAGLIIAFKDLKPGSTIFESSWVGFKWFHEFFMSPYFWRSMKNTVVISTVSLIASFPLSIIFALMLNEIRFMPYKRIAQSISYFPYFISTVIVIQILNNFIDVESGLVNNLIELFGGERINFYLAKQWFLPLYVITDIWKTLGWSAIIYLSALTSIDLCLYEAATIDGANRFQKMWHISFPGIAGTVIILLLLNLGNLLSLGYEKIILMYNPAIYDVSDVVSTYVYREGIQNMRFGYATAIGFFNQILNFIVLIASNYFSRRFSEHSLW
jgi:ABC-type polysaccharide transport system, permease component